jgi:FAD/FMN-containing dehydrogenase
MDAPLANNRGQRPALCVHAGGSWPKLVDDSEVRGMQRRTLLKAMAALPLAARFGAFRTPIAAWPVQAGRQAQWVRPGEPGWPSPAQWSALRDSVGGRLVPVQSAFTVCEPDAGSAACANLFQNLADPFFIDQSVNLTQTLGWLDAFTSAPSAYAVLAASSADVAAAVNFAREHNVRLVVKSGGHSYLGTSNAPDSLLIWTRPNMQAIEVLDGFVPQGAPGLVEPEPAVSVAAGAIWMDAYNAVTTVAGRYVQGGGCTTVGVSGLTQGGGFGSWSKTFGTAAANLLEAEVVTADGTVRVVSAFQEPDLFWALKGGGGGTFGVVTRFTLRTHPLPDYFGLVSATISATSAPAYRALVAQMISFYRESLFNSHWGEQIDFGPGSQITILMLWQGLTLAQAEQAWAPFFDWVAARPADYQLAPPGFLAVPARDFWNAAWYEQFFPTLISELVVPDPLPGAPADYFYWGVNAAEVGWFLDAFQSTWLSQRLLEPENQAALVDALVRASQLWSVQLACNKGLAGGAPAAMRRTADTSMNPAVLDSFALALVTAQQNGVVYPGIPGHEPDVAQGRQQATLAAAAIAPLTALRDEPASYFNETDYFQDDWQTAFWGEHYARLLQVKKRYDPDGLFFVHHGVGTDT